MENQQVQAAVEPSDNLTSASVEGATASEASVQSDSGEPNNQASDDLQVQSEGDYWSALEQLKNQDVSNGESQEVTPDGDAQVGSGGDNVQNDDEGSNAEGQESQGDEGSDEGEGGESPADSAQANQDEPNNDDLEGEEFVKRFYAKHRPEVEQYALTLLTRNRDLSMDEALAKAKAHYGVDQDAGDDDGSASDEQSQTNTVDSIRERLADLRAQRKEAKSDLDFDREAELQEQIEDILINDLPEAQKAEQNKQSQKQQDFDSKWTESQSKAVEFYDFVKDGNSEQSKRMTEIDGMLKANNDPLFFDPEKPFILAQMVAREYAIAPKSKAQRSAPVPPKPKPVAKPVQPASGNARTVTQPVNNQAKQLQQAVEGIQDEESFEAALSQFKAAGVL